MSDEKYIAKLGKLLRQAERAGTPEEAATAQKLAQKFATDHQISLELARQHQADKEKREKPIQKQITLGERRQRGLFTYVELFHQIALANDVQINVAHNSTYVIAFGFPSDIEVVEALYTSLVVQMVDASEKYLRSGEYKAETVRRPVYGESYWGWDARGRYRKLRDIEEYVYKPVNGSTARISFQEAFARKVGARLREARQEAIAEAEARRVEERAAFLKLADSLFRPESAEKQDGEPGTELVLANKAVEVADFYKQKSDAKGSYRGGKGVSQRAYGAQSAGREAGSRARLGGERAITSGQRQIAG